MKKTVCKCFLACLVFAFIMMLNVPAFAKSSKKKVVMPKTIKESSVNEDGEVSPYNSTEYTIKYDKSGRITKISGVSKATDGTWTYTISYKKSGKNTKATINYVPDWAEDPETYTYKFNSKGRLISNHKSSDWEWDYDDDSKESILFASDNYLVYFDENAKLDTFYRLSGEKIQSLAIYEIYDYKKERLNEKMTFYFGDGVELESITEDFLAESEKWISQYEIKTSKVSMTDAVKWMNTVILLDFVYRE